MILRQRLSSCTIKDVEGQAFQALLLVAMSRCSNCKRNGASWLVSFSRELAQAVDEEWATVPFVLE